MKINEQNYEAYFLDYIEGTLDIQTLSELMLFLKNNPQYKEALNTYSNININNTTEIFANKGSLYKLEFSKSPVTSNNFNDYCIAFFENLLNDKKKEEFLKFLQKNNQYYPDFILYSKAKLQPANNIVFPGKDTLYHKKYIVKPTIRNFIIWGSSVAASIIAVILLLSPGPQNPIAQNMEKDSIRNSNTIALNFKMDTTTEKNTLKPQPQIISKKYIETIAHTRVDTHSISNKKTMYRLLEPLTGLAQTSVKNNTYPLNPNFENYIEDKIIPKTINEELIAFTDDNEEKRKSNLMALAESGLNKFNQLTGSNIEISHKTDPSGKMNTFSLNTGLFGIYRKRTKIE